MPDHINLYDHAYGNYEQDVYRQIRVETYGNDLGQTSWVTSEESESIPRLLNIGPDSNVLEIGFGSGRYALHLAGRTGCRLIGVDVNVQGVQSARQLARQHALESRVDFVQHDASEPLPFASETFDAAFSNDALCHVGGRDRVLSEVHRVLNPGGLFLFSDALVIGGSIDNQELATRSSIGFYLFVSPGVNEKLLNAAGFGVIRATDTTENAATIARRWRDARLRRKAELLAFEGNDNYEGLQNFLTCVHNLTSERRLLRLLYIAGKP